MSVEGDRGQRQSSRDLGLTKPRPPFGGPPIEQTGLTPEQKFNFTLLCPCAWEALRLKGDMRGQITVEGKAMN